MNALEIFMNDDSASGLDPLIKMAIIHHQFQSIHPFADGNGRIGRILNVIYLTKAELLDIPILYISRFINQNKQQYYALLQAVRDAQDKTEAWQAWVCWMLEAVAETSATTLVLVEGIRQQMQDTKDKLRSDLPHLYSQDLLNNLFRHPYTRIEFVKNDLSVSRPTASKYLKELAAAGLVEERKAGRNLYYVNTRLVALLLEVSGKER
jgi:Fic family protein